MTLRLIMVIALMVQCIVLHAQKRITSKQVKDSIYIEQIEEHAEPDKILHAEPLYIDLIRDLGARKGEHEWNLGMGITDNYSYDTYETLIEYEFAPMDRLGLEVEVPFTFYTPLSGTERDDVPSHRAESLKLAGQWTFLVAPKINTSAAIGYINEFVLADINAIRHDNILVANVFNPFLIVAKRWGSNFHSLIYTGPVIEKSYKSSHVESLYAMNTNIHYMIPGTRNFVGIEFNKEWRQHDFDMVIRPQLRVSIADNLMIGIIGGIPVNRENQRLSTFARLIWEPGTKHQ